MPSARNEMLEALGTLPPDAFATRFILERQPWFFGSHEAYLSWKEPLALGLGVDTCAVSVVGSAAVGLSLSPNKNFRSFNAESDVDVAVISARHFDLAWSWLRSLGSKRYKLPTKARNAVDDHINRLIFWGAIATDKILEHLPFAIDWGEALLAAGGAGLTENRTVNARIYRDHDALRSYQLIAVKAARQKLLET